MAKNKIAIMAEVSIIVPIYNAEPYLAALLDSILSQDFGDYELLLVDDGSSDGSAALCREYAARDPRIRLLRQENRGVSAARNLGLDHVSPDSRYIYFCDADDTLRPGALRLLVDAMAGGSRDLAIAGYNWYNPDGSVYFEMESSPIETLSPDDTIHKIFIRKDLRTQDVLWNKLFRADLIREHHLRYDEQIHYTEDILFITAYACRIRRDTAYTTTPVYNYCVRRSGAMTSVASRFNTRYLSAMESASKIKKLVFGRTRNFTLRLAALKKYYTPYVGIHEMMEQSGHYDRALHRRLWRQLISDGALLPCMITVLHRHRHQLHHFLP